MSAIVPRMPHQARQAVDQLFSRISEERLLNQPWMHSLRTALLLDRSTSTKTSSNRAVQALLFMAIGHGTVTARQDHWLDRTGSKGLVQYRQAVALWEKLITRQPGNQEYLANLARTLYDLGIVTVITGRPAR